jgi:hypothetical protein
LLLDNPELANEIEVKIREKIKDMQSDKADKADKTDKASA